MKIVRVAYQLGDSTCADDMATYLIGDMFRAATREERLRAFDAACIDPFFGPTMDSFYTDLTTWKPEDSRLVVPGCEVLRFILGPNPKHTLAEVHDSFMSGLRQLFDADELDRRQGPLLLPADADEECQQQVAELRKWVAEGAKELAST